MKKESLLKDVLFVILTFIIVYLVLIILSIFN